MTTTAPETFVYFSLALINNLERLEVSASSPASIEADFAPGIFELRTSLQVGFVSHRIDNRPGSLVFSHDESGACVKIAVAGNPGERFALTTNADGNSVLTAKDGSLTITTDATIVFNPPFDATVPQNPINGTG